jgi:hypothetical protein
LGSRVGFALLSLAIVVGGSMVAGCAEEGSVDTATLRKEIAAPKDPNRNFSDKMEKYKIGGANSPPGMKGQAPQVPKKGG